MEKWKCIKYNLDIYMKTKELEAAKENGVKKAPESIELLLTDKQSELLADVLKQKDAIQQRAQEIANKEVMVTTLILDAHGHDADNVTSAQLNEQQTVLAITIKE